MVIILSDMLHYSEECRRGFILSEGPIRVKQLFDSLTHKVINTDDAGDVGELLDSLCMLIFNACAENEDFQNAFIRINFLESVASFLATEIDYFNSHIAIMFMQDNGPPLHFIRLPFSQSLLLCTHALVVLNEEAQDVISTRCLPGIFREVMKLHVFLMMCPDHDDKRHVFNMYSIFNLLLSSLREGNDRAISMYEKLCNTSARDLNTHYQQLFQPWASNAVNLVIKELPSSAMLEAYCVLNDELKNIATNHFNEEAVT